MSKPVAPVAKAVTKSLPTKKRVKKPMQKASPKKPVKKVKTLKSGI